MAEYKIWHIMKLMLIIYLDVNTTFGSDLSNYCSCPAPFYRTNVPKIPTYLYFNILKKFFREVILPDALIES